MSGEARQAYLETKVLTATPQKLRLLCIDAAVVLLNRTQTLWGEENWDSAYVCVAKARALVTDILSTMKFQSDPLAKQLAAIYASIVITITEAQLTNDAVMLGKAIAILEEERETWRQYCEMYPDAPELPDESASEITSSDPAIAAPSPANAKLGTSSGIDLTSEGSFDSSTSRSMKLPPLGIGTKSHGMNSQSSSGINFDA